MDVAFLVLVGDVLRDGVYLVFTQENMTALVIIVQQQQQHCISKYGKDEKRKLKKDGR